MSITMSHLQRQHTLPVVPSFDTIDSDYDREQDYIQMLIQQKRTLTEILKEKQ